MSDSQNIKFKRPKPVVLIVLDGWGVSPEYSGNAITTARTPTMDRLTREYPATTLQASGEAVGLPWGESGNSEVGHLSLGLGKILYQDLPRINRDIGSQKFYQNPVFLRAKDHVAKHGSTLHFMGLASSGGVHSSVDHLNALLIFAAKQGVRDVCVHIFLDGRDTSYNAGVNYVKGVKRSLAENKIGRIATISGRFYAMDRNNNWDRTEKAYLAMTEGKGNQSSDPLQAVEDSYKKKIYDEEFVPTVITDAEGNPTGLVKDGDAVIFYNFRPDRARQITKAFVLPLMDKFNRPKKLDNLFFAGFTEYEKGLPMEVAFPAETIDNTLGQTLSAHKMSQLRIAETEKYAHVTYFFNGGQEHASEGEDHVLVPSPSVSDYSEKPEMSAPEITKRVLAFMRDDKYDFVLINFANTDMIGHTGNLQAAVKAVETVDKQLEKIVRTVLLKDGVLLVTADHGNAENMFSLETGQMDKEHTCNPVPFIAVKRDYAGRNFGWPEPVNNDLSSIEPQGILSDIAPTVLHIMGIPKPADMTGVSLIK
jgi:2,3-bisphosphoglycerate-independent phosphoglycerate mutase